jgi:hypothetical protein
MNKYILVMILGVVGAPVYAQGVKDPSTPNARAVYPANPPSQPSRSTATKNIPPASAAPPLGVRPAYRHGYRNGSRTR